MSIECIARVLPWPLGGTAKLVLLGLANHAHPDGTRTHPAVGTLAEYAHCDRRTVQRALRTLEVDGWIVREERIGAKGTTSYRIPPHPPEWRAAECRPRQDAAGGASVATGAAPAPPEPSVEPSVDTPLPPSRGNRRRDRERRTAEHRLFASVYRDEHELAAYSVEDVAAALSWVRPPTGTSEQDAAELIRAWLAERVGEHVA